MTQNLLERGAEVFASVSCYGTDSLLKDRAANLPEEDVGRQFDWSYDATKDTPVCLLIFKMMRSSFVESVRYNTYDASTAGTVPDTIYETVGISVATGYGAGSIYVYDMNAFVVAITSIMVLLSIPSKVIQFIAVNALGSLSKMYKRLIVEPFDAAKETAVVAAALAVNTKNFNDLADISVEGVPYISHDHLTKFLCTALKSKGEELDDKEIERIASFCTQTMTEPTKDPWAAVKRRLSHTTSVKVAPDDTQNRAQPAASVNLNQFNECLLSKERVDMDTIAKLFDRDRQQTCLEKLFAPGKIEKIRSVRTCELPGVSVSSKEQGREDGMSRTLEK